MYGEWIKLCLVNRSNVNLIKSLSQKNNELESEAKIFEKVIVEKNSEIDLLKNELSLLKKNVMMLNPGSSIFEEIQNAGQRNCTGLGSNGSQSKGKTVFVPAKTLNDCELTLQVPDTSTSRVESSKQVQKGKNSMSFERTKRFIPTCHFCGVKGHIRPKCFTMMNCLKSKSPRHEKFKNDEKKQVFHKQVWKRKDENKCLSVFCDDISARNVSENHVQHSHIKHIDMRHHFIRELVEQKTLISEYFETAKQIADILTKSLDYVGSDSLRKFLGVCCVLFSALLNFVISTRFATYRL